MKLRNLLFGTMIACAFVACSNDDDPTPEPTPEVGTGTLIAGLDSKALTKANSSEITSLIVALYRADGSFVQSATLADNQPTEIEADNDVKFTGLPVDVEYTIVAFANMPTTFNAAQSLSTVVATPIQLPSGAYSTGGYPMSSQGIDKVTLKANTTTFYGYTQAEFDAATTEGTKELVAANSPVKLYRNVAKVNLNKVTLNVPTNEKFTSGKAEVTLDAAIILNAANTSLAADVKGAYSTNNWGSVQNLTGNAFDAGTWFKKDGTTAFAVKPDYITSESAVTYTEANYIATLTNTLNQAALGTGVNTGNDQLASFYVFENHGEASTSKTILTLRGTYKFDAITTNGAPYAEARTEAYWPLQVGITGLTDGVKDGVHRNVQYDITITITGHGNLDPTTPDVESNMFVKTEVVEWGHISQDVPIE